MSGEHGVSEIDPLERSSVSGELHLIRLHTPATRRVKRKSARVPQDASVRGLMLLT